MTVEEARQCIITQADNMCESCIINNTEWCDEWCVGREALEMAIKALNKDAMEELKPCPFCGAEAKMTKSEGLGYSIGCTNDDGNCGVMPSTIYYRTAGKAVEAWNRRMHD